jgi:hypothetical protein
MADEITLDAPETRLERFLAAAAGMEGITLDEPVTRIEKYLYKIAQGSGGGSGGGVLVVTDTDRTLDKTWQEIHDAMLTGLVVIQGGSMDSGINTVTQVYYDKKGGAYKVHGGSSGNWSPAYTASSADGYPTF